ncbi:MAG: hypothetical protein HY738_05105 [Bacteroidia bacterium]|nr:hypothetical protein [Bacteroidia bacterium]
MDKDIIEKKLKYELELLKIYAFFIAVTGTGTISSLLRENFPATKKELMFIVLGIIIFVTFVILGITSFIRIKQLYKKL